MFRKYFYLIFIVTTLLFTSGCGIINTAIAAGIAYGIYRATNN